MTTSTDLTATREALAKARDEVTRAQVELHHTNTDLANAIRTHIAAVTRRSFPDAAGLMIHFPELRSRRSWAPRLARVIAAAPHRAAICPTLWKSDDGPTAELPVTAPWWSAIPKLESLAEEYARLTRAYDWPWCDRDGDWRLFLFPETRI